MRVIPIDVSAFALTVAMGPAVPVMEQGGKNQRGNAAGEPLFQVPIAFGTPDGTASVVNVRVAGAAPTVQVGAPVVITGLVGRVWEMSGRHGISYSAVSVRPAGGSASKG
ncbi:conserved hypothetical protein [Frankia sp. Hr75.2]|nr:conserved hypothetical protein [Frankia sp. Hr75.2]